jgi:hypothetical protein
MKMKKKIGVVKDSGYLSLNMRRVVAVVKIKSVEIRSSPANRSPAKPSKNVKA